MIPGFVIKPEKFEIGIELNKGWLLAITNKVVSLNEFSKFVDTSELKSSLICLDFTIGSKF